MIEKPINPIDQRIGARIRMRRNELKISQTSLAAGLNLTFQQVQKYEKGKNRVGGSRMAEIARLLEVEVGFFYQGAPGAGLSRGPVDSTMDSFMATKDGLVIAEAFVQIADPEVRRAVAQAIGQIGRALAPKPIALKPATLMAAE